MGIRRVLVAFVLAGTLIAGPALAAPPDTPPVSAMTMLAATLQEHGRYMGYEADYEAVNRILLAKLADAIDLVERSPRPVRQGDRIEPVMATWRTLNRDFIQDLAHENANVRNLAAQPLRKRMAEHALYDKIVAALRKNVACLREITGEWTAPENRE